MKVLLGLFALISIGMNANAQYGESIRTGHPGQAIGGFALGQGVFQVQSGIDLNPNSSNPTNKITTIGEDAVFRYGITETFEWQYNKLYFKCKRIRANNSFNRNHWLRCA
ncbi:MAG: hypothetical protein ACJAZ3_001718 [Sphingobacteriales bacterium]